MSYESPRGSLHLQTGLGHSNPNPPSPSEGSEPGRDVSLFRTWPTDSIPAPGEPLRGTLGLAVTHPAPPPPPPRGVRPHLSAVSNTAEETWARGPQAPRAGGQQDETSPSQPCAGPGRGQVTQPGKACGETAGRESAAPGAGAGPGEGGLCATPPHPPKRNRRPRRNQAELGAAHLASRPVPSRRVQGEPPHQRVSPSRRVPVAAGCCPRHVRPGRHQAAVRLLRSQADGGRKHRAASSSPARADSRGAKRTS